MTVPIKVMPEDRTDWKSLSPREQAEYVAALQPIHPGEILRIDFLEPLRLSQNALAQKIKVTPTRINQIVRGQRSITPETALRLEKYFRVSAHFWLGLQAKYDLEVQQHRLRDALDRIRPFQPH